ncbi:MAG: hypothetical protein IAE82_20695 [Opitutaceae bacterium]|nr:hypothetical protein [Opitutaceae bacterium]
MLVALHAPSPGHAAPARVALDTPIVVTQVPADSIARGDLYEGARLIVVTPDGRARPLSEGFASACDPDVSFDGQRVLFAGRRSTDDRWRIWEIGIDGQGLRAISPDNLDARSAIHVSTLFTLDSPKPWFTTVFVGREATTDGPATPWNLYNIRLEGGEVRRLTFNHGSNVDPFQTNDGRVLYAAERSPQEPGEAALRMSLFAIHMEGADNELYGGARGARFQRMPCATERGLVVFVESTAPTVDGSGQLACVEQRRPHVTYRPLTTDPAHRFLHPAPLRDNQVLVARRPAADAGTWGVFAFDADSGRCDPLVDDPQYHEMQAVVVAPRRQPDGHSTVVTVADTTGAFYGLNCYTADPARAAGTKPGEVKRIRFLESVTTPPQSGANLSGLVPRRIIGEAPVESDGSFNVVVPADTPLLLQTLDERGLALGTCGWVWVKPKESRGCIGCHEDPELVPENNYVQALRRLPNHLLTPPEERRTVTFLRDIVPILQKSCATAQCHSSTMSPLHLPLAAAAPSATDLRKAYDALTVPATNIVRPPDAAPAPGKYVDAGRARTSRLVWTLLGENTARPWDPATASAAHGARPHRADPQTGEVPQLSAEELRTVLLWIDLGAPFDLPSSAPAAPAIRPTP